MNYIVPEAEESVKGGVYRLVVGRFYYYGRTSDFRKRWKSHLSHLRKGNHQNRKLQSAYNKYGESAVRYRPLLKCPRDAAALVEAELIESCIDDRDCANFRRENGESYTHSQESRELMSRSRKGRQLSEETKRKLSEVLSTRFFSDTHRKRISDALRGRSFSAETKQRMSEGARRRGYQVGTTRPVLVKHPENTAQFFLTVRYAADFVGINKHKLSAYLRGARPIPRRLAGYHFSYLDKTRENWSIFPTACAHEHYGITAP